MKRMTGLMILCIITVMTCSKKPDVVTLEKDSPEYLLGKELAMTLPLMDPDSNKILITSKSFDISVGELLQLMKSYMGNQTQTLKNVDGNQLSMFIQQTAMQVAEKKILLKAAHKAKVQVISAEMDSILNREYQQFGGEEQYIQTIQNQGIDINTVKQDIHDRVLIDQYLRKVIQEKSQITEADIQSAYQEFLQDTVATVRHILLLTESMDDDKKKETRANLESILARAKKGEDFAALAKEFTEDPGSKENGGLYEDFSRGTMVKSFEDAAFTVPIGDISDIVETQYGYHILKVIDRKQNNAPFEEVRSELEEQLRGPASSEIVPSLLEELKEKENLKEITF